MSVVEGQHVQQRVLAGPGPGRHQAAGLGSQGGVGDHHALDTPPSTQCTAGHEGEVADISCMSIFSACFGLLTSIQLTDTTWSGQIWISGWILPHFDVRTISVA